VLVILSIWCVKSTTVNIKGEAGSGYRRNEGHFYKEANEQPVSHSYHLGEIFPFSQG
ncbi:hypothetical protein Bpfe_004389, partial [Biomphalaria pfeifferi]